ncbi:signal peptidase complex subunit 2 [Gongronella butleri]|nr:signal peptidase complex subunit 2 [Gongronella butleri]
MANTTTATETNKDQEPIQVDNKYDGKQLKHTLDDEIARYLGNEGGYKQSHQHAYVKLVFGYLSCFIAAGQFLYERKHGFDNVKFGTLGCVLFFWVFQSAIWLYTRFIENNEIFAAFLYDGKTHAGTVSVTTEMHQYSPEYHIHCLYTNELTHKSVRCKVTTNVEQWFNEDGQLMKDAFDQHIKDAVSKVHKHLHQE